MFSKQNACNTFFIIAIFLLSGCHYQSKHSAVGLVNAAEISQDTDSETNTQNLVLETLQPQQEFYKMTMNSAPFLPKNQKSRQIACDIQSQAEGYLSAQEVNYAQKGWEQRISHDPVYFSLPRQAGRILLIDFAQKQHVNKEDEQAVDSELAYRYLSNDNTHHDLYEPWSSSKIFAFSAAIASLREQNLGAQATIGDTYVADMITGINSYEDFGTSSGESNALATFFANIAGRDYLSSLFYDEWLNLSQEGIFFRGAYGPVAFVPSSYVWKDLNSEKSIEIQPYLDAAQDPGYLAYRCDNCGLTGNKPMTTLAQAEWLKRLAAHDRETATRHPNLTSDDISTLFYGTGHSYDDDRFAGMTLGISTMLQHAIVNAITKKDVSDPKRVLDELTNGEWRVFQKIGWGPSETRSTTENVVLAHVCLPHFQGGREFTVAAQVSVPEAKEENLPLAGKKMQALLQMSLAEYFHEPKQ